MADKQPQTFANHTRFDPVFHFFLAPVSLFGVVYSLVHLYRHLNRGGFSEQFHSAVFVLFAVALFVLVFKLRLYSLKVQDRVIRLEERVRMMQLLSDPLRSRIPELTIDQMCGLRFASDAELPKLVERALNEKLSRKQIKQAIQNWRPDYWRV